jgi:hypothetical protein
MRREVVDPLGGPSRPLGFEDVLAKARLLAATSRAADEVESLIAFARELDRLPGSAIERLRLPSTQ